MKIAPNFLENFSQKISSPDLIFLEDYTDQMSLYDTLASFLIYFFKILCPHDPLKKNLFLVLLTYTFQ